MLLYLILMVLITCKQHSRSVCLCGADLYIMLFPCNLQLCILFAMTLQQKVKISPLRQTSYWSDKKWRYTKELDDNGTDLVLTTNGIKERLAVLGVKHRPSRKRN